MAKTPEEQGRLIEVLSNAAEALRITAVLVSPVMPDAARRMWEQLGFPGSAEDPPISETARFGAAAGGAVMKKGPPLFPRIEE